MQRALPGAGGLVLLVLGSVALCSLESSTNVNCVSRQLVSVSLYIFSQPCGIVLKPGRIGFNRLDLLKTILPSLV